MDQENLCHYIFTLDNFLKLDEISLIINQINIKNVIITLFDILSKFHFAKIKNLNQNNFNENEQSLTSDSNICDDTYKIIVNNFLTKKNIRI